MIPSTESISLEDPMIKEWAGSALAKVVQLHNDLGKEIYIDTSNTSNTRDISFLPVPHSSDSINLIKHDL